MIEQPRVISCGPLIQMAHDNHASVWMLINGQWTGEFWYDLYLPTRESHMRRCAEHFIETCEWSSTQ